MENLTESYRVPLNQMHGFCCIQAPGINRQERRSMFRSFMLIIIFWKHCSGKRIWKNDFFQC